MPASPVDGVLTHIDSDRPDAGHGLRPPDQRRPGDRRSRSAPWRTATSSRPGTSPSTWRRRRRSGCGSARTAANLVVYRLEDAPLTRPGRARTLGRATATRRRCVRVERRRTGARRIARRSHRDRAPDRRPRDALICSSSAGSVARRRCDGARAAARPAASGYSPAIVRDRGLELVVADDALERALHDPVRARP